MTRSDLIQKIHRINPGLTHQQAEKSVALIFDEITSALSRGRRVELRGFGIFTTRDRSARTGRNPRTGDKVKVPQKAVPFFKAGKLLRDKINNRV